MLATTAASGVLEHVTGAPQFSACAQRPRAAEAAKRCARLKKQGLGGGAGAPGTPQPPALSVSLFAVLQRHRKPLTYSRPSARHAGPRGRRTSPACGSCRRPRRSNEKQGIEEYCAKAQNASFSSLFSSGRANQGKINGFRAPGTGAPARRTFKNAYLSMVFKGARAKSEQKAPTAIKK